jgi:hypothetical protein
MTVLRMVLTPLLLEKPQPYGGNSAVVVELPHAALGAPETEGRPDATETFVVAWILMLQAAGRGLPVLPSGQHPVQSPAAVPLSVTSRSG